MWGWLYLALNDYLFVNIFHNFPLSKPKGCLGILTSTHTECNDRFWIECGACLAARHGFVPCSECRGSKSAEYLKIDFTPNNSSLVSRHLLCNFQRTPFDWGEILAETAWRKLQAQVAAVVWGFVSPATERKKADDNVFTCVCVFGGGGFPSPRLPSKSMYVVPSESVWNCLKLHRWPTLSLTIKKHKIAISY